MPFRVHDIDNNTKLDGLELLHALQHTLHGDEDGDSDNRVEDDQDKDLSVDYSWIVGEYEKNAYVNINVDINVDC